MEIELFSFFTKGPWLPDVSILLLFLIALCTVPVSDHFYPFLIVQVASGGIHTVGLKPDGTVVAMRWNDSGQLNLGAMGENSWCLGGMDTADAAFERRYSAGRSVFRCAIPFRSTGRIETDLMELEAVSVCAGRKLGPYGEAV